MVEHIAFSINANKKYETGFSILQPANSKMNGSLSFFQTWLIYLRHPLILSFKKYPLSMYVFSTSQDTYIEWLTNQMCSLLSMDLV